MTRELFNGVAHPEQLRLLTEALQSYCAEARIEVGTDEYDNVAHLIMTLFMNGAATPEELFEALRRQSGHPMSKASERSAQKSERPIA